MKELEFTCRSLETDFKFQKDIKSDEMSYSCEHTKKRHNIFFLQQREISKEFILKFLKNYYKKIKKIAYFIEELSGLTGDFYSKDIISKTISNDLFSVVITLDYSKMLNCKNMIITNLTISTSNPLFNEYKKNWYGRENIYDIVEKNKEEILKRIPISIYSLPAELKNIYYTSLERKNNKEKTLTKSKILK